MTALLGEGISLLLGVSTGLFFERRYVRDTERSNEQLRMQVTGLRTALFSFTGSPNDALEEPRGLGDLTEQVTLRAIATQDPSGRVDRSALVAHFLEASFCLREIDEVLASLCLSGVAKEEGAWLRMG
jgi:hypothetical protein